MGQKVKLDEYTVRARAFPVFIVLAPFAASLGQFTDAKSLPFGVATAFGGTALLSFVAAQWGRDAGKGKEERLFALWGGKPTTQYLRNRNDGGNSDLWTRRRVRLERLAPDLILPSLAAEADDPISADTRYETATKVLIQRTRDKKRFAVLFQELTDYGFRRNIWGLKSSAITVVCLSLLLSTAHAIIKPSWDFNFPYLVPLCCVLAVWCFYVTPVWVRRAADAYSERLFDSLDTMTELDKLQLPKHKRKKSTRKP